MTQLVNLLVKVEVQIELLYVIKKCKKKRKVHSEQTEGASLEELWHDLKAFI